MKKKVVNLLLIIVVLIMIALNILIYIKNNSANENEELNENVQASNESLSEKEIENTINSRIEGIPDRNRMQVYFGTFITYIENNEYEKAYALLNENFKNNYFKTLSSFESYFENYPKNIMVNYTDIDRQGELYILTVEISDMFDEETEPISQRVVIRENDLNDFTLSFQVE